MTDLRHVVLPFPLVLLCACGARTELGISGGPPEPCTKPPWVVFDYASPETQHGGISAMRADGSSFHQLDLSGVIGLFPMIAADSKSMVFGTFLSENPQQVEGLNVFEFSTRTNRTLAQTVIDSSSNGFSIGAISPDNQLVAYAVDYDLVHVVGFDGSNDRVLSMGACGLSWQVDGRPVFSADSSTLYISGSGCFESIHTDGTADTLLENQVTLIAPNPSFSPEHQRFVAQVACSPSELRVFSIGDLPGDPCSAGTKLVEVGASMAWNQSANAAWGPSNLIAYESGKDIMLIDLTGSAPRNLTADITTGPNDVASDPTWASGCAELP